MSTLVPLPTQTGGVVLSESSAAYGNASRSEATWNAYRSDLKAYQEWGGTLPATPQQIVDWITAQANAGRSAATIQRRLSSMSMIHRAEGWPNPTTDETVREIHRGIRRTIGTAPNKKAAMQSADLKAYFGELNGDLRHLRNKVILVWGLATACRRSELVALTVEDLEPIEAGFRVRLKKSKTDQEQKGRFVAVVYGADPVTDPVRLMRAWLDRAGITSGPIFRPIDKAGKVGGGALSSRTVANIVKACAEAVGKDPASFGGHSLRRGFITETARAGASEREISKQTGHKSMNVLRGYIEATNVEIDNAVSKLGL